MLREELQLLQEQGSHVGEVIKAMDKKKVLVKVWLYYVKQPLCVKPYLYKVISFSMSADTDIVLLFL